MNRLTLMALLVAMPVLAATPPDRMHYQGVLRDAAGDPLDGSFDMVFKLFSAETLGDEILLDRHLAVNLQAVQVAEGLFGVGIGDGEMLDGSGPGTYTSLAEVFAAHGDVWLEVQIGSETLAPRTRVAAAGYALNAGRLDGKPAGDFLDNSAGEQFKEGKLVVGQTSGTAQAYGIEGYGLEGGGYFADTDGTGAARVGWNNIGVRASGDYAGGYFVQPDGSAEVHLAFGDLGIQSRGYTNGGLFESSNWSGSAYVGYGDAGIRASGDQMGGQFYDGDQTGFAYAGIGDVGIEGYGQAHGGYFEDSGQSGHAYLGRGDRGVEGFGNETGGYFRDLGGSGYAYAGFGHYGVQGYGDIAGGYFKDDNSSGYAYVGYGDYGIRGYGYTAGGYFQDTNASGYASVGVGDRGIQGYGTNAGGYFADTNSSSYAITGYGSYKIWGSGAVSFVQNHPEDADKVVVYHAPESSEVGVYTRGSGRLTDGAAVLPLDPTFRWVTNPDLGLTAHVTPSGNGCVIYKVSVSTEELAVRSDDPACADGAFDYMVWGLRIGFEGATPVQPKQQEAFIPSMSTHDEFVRKEPELAAFTAASRFGADKIDRSAADALLKKIHVFDPAVDSLPEPMVESPAGAGVNATAVATVEAAEAAGEPAAEEPVTERAPVALLPTIPVGEPVATGDLLVMDEGGRLVIALGEADPGVVGIAVGESAAVDGALLAPVATSGIVELKVDADLGSIVRGDLLVSSPTPGHAMRAYAAAPGTVIAKALEPLEAGQGTIRVVVTLR